MDPTALTIHELAELLEKREISSVRLTGQFIERIARINPKLNAYLAVTESQALAAAEAADARLAKGEAGRLAGRSAGHKRRYLH